MVELSSEYAAVTTRPMIGKRLRSNGLVRARRRAFYLAVGRSGVTVRFSHIIRQVHCRSISGSFMHGRISGGVETLPEQGTPGMVVGARRGMATERLVAAPLLRS